ncbi:hypothetical protein [Candidatus Albibeggiatoa sp. nov. NOAA]|uniref:hypothetical protein n=1 Tax=Candidatus Albibeggiatoa sp. nov. NOAA TaxID=3162724 RepID=UPI0032F7B88E|nr:hypothetical protein [Thiotrichaceae bacterium]
MITIDYDTEQQLYKLAQEEGTEPEKLIKKLLSFYLGEEPKPELSERKHSNVAKKSKPELIRDLGLIGCFSAEPELSENYKAVLSESWDKKYDNS